jgi:phospholipid/cholesterol/gamma-HCH transport system substrate-binding protein
MMTSTQRLTALGLLVVVTGALFVWGLFFLLGNPIWERGVAMVVVLEDGARLRRGDRVLLHGVEVGSVQAVELRSPRKVVVDLRLRQGIILPADSRAAVQVDVFGTGSVDLLPGHAVVALEAGDTIPGLTSRPLPALMADLGDRAGSLLASADSLLSPSAVADLHATSAILPASAEALRAAFAELHLAATSLRRTVEEFEGAETGTALTRTLEEIQGSAHAMTRVATALEESLIPLGSVLTKVDQGAGTLGLLVNDSTLYQELSNTLREIRVLAVDVRERPRRYLGISIF